MIELCFGVVIGAGLMACVASWRTVPQKPDRDRRGRFVKGRPMTRVERTAKVEKALEHASRETGTFGR